jgi:hypothetical protein
MTNYELRITEENNSWLWTVIGALMLAAWLVCRLCEWLRLDVWDREGEI